MLRRENEEQRCMMENSNEEAAKMAPTCEAVVLDKRKYRFITSR